MAQFIARIQGQRGSASRLGSKNSGIRATVNGWNLGVSISAHNDGISDVFDIYKTYGSNNTERVHLIKTIRERRKK